MTDRINPQENKREERIQPRDIKALIEKHGKAKIGNEEFTLQQPAATESPHAVSAMSCAAPHEQRAFRDQSGLDRSL